MRPPPFDRELADNLRRLGDQVPPPLRFEHIAERRERGRRERLTDQELRRGGAFTVEERDVPGAHARLLVCRPTGPRPPVAALYWVHGGGMVLGHNREGADEFLDWAERFRLVVVSVEYRLAPETPHPGPVEDCWAGLQWLVEHGAELGVPPARIVVAGVSAGGGIAAALALMARDRGGPTMLGQLLICPMLDDRNDTVSAIQMQGRDVWDRTANDTGWTALLGAARGTRGVSPYAAPARATDLSDLPSTYLDVGSAETFRDEVVDYAVRLWRAGGHAELHVWPGAFHTFDGWVPAARLSREARAARMRWLERLLTPPADSAADSH
ncbi:alpha/beta hydrolase [Micromonospora sp. NPDC018662]|uniref:alpha/beta hydrolase n=1 Tax=Micromonospora sp. NPDC018662 TaxID=3364238 RepID=UPI003791F51F